MKNPKIIILNQIIKNKNKKNSKLIKRQSKKKKLK